MADTEILQLIRQLIAHQEQLNKVLDAQCRSFDTQCKAVDMLAKRVTGLSQAPFGVVFVVIISAFFYIGKISDLYWLIGCAIAALPYYSEYVPLMLKIWQKKETK